MKTIMKSLKIYVSAVLIMAMMLSIASSALASNNIWYDNYVALENSIGDNSYNNPASSSLAWTESYVLRSYLQMYDLTKDTDWLDKFTTHADTITSNATDEDNDGYSGWATYTYSPVELGNYGFETASSSDSTLPDEWVRFQSTSSTAYLSTTAAYNGSYGTVIKTNGTTWQKLYQQMNDYEPYTKYTLRIHAKTNGSAAKGKAYVHDRTTNTILASIVVDSTSWGFYSVEFTTPAAGNNIQIWLGHESYNVTGGEAYFDEVKVSGRFPYLVHDGMIGLPLAEFVRLIDQNTGLQSSYLANANSYQSLLENEIIPRWENSSYIGNTWNGISSTTGIYKQSPYLATLKHGQEGMNLPYNMSLAFGHMLLVLYDVNGNASYLDRAEKMGQYFKNNLTMNGTAYNWNYQDTSTSAPEDTSHGHVDMAFVFEMYDHGLVFNGTDMERFANTLTDVMWNQSLSAPTLARYVSGLSPSQTQYSKIMMNWLDLSWFRRITWSIAAEQFRNYTPQNTGDLLTLTHIMKWDPAKLVNQGFEWATSFDNTYPAQWYRLNSNSSTAYLDNMNNYSGDYGATVVANGSSWQYLYQPWEDWTPNTSYTITFKAKTDGSAAGGRIIVKNETTGLSLLNTTFTNTSWDTKTFTFTSPSNASDTTRIYLANSDWHITGGKAHFDDIKIKATADSW